MIARLILLATICVMLLSACTPTSGVYHPVKKGQTLYRIGKAYGVDSRYLARINAVDDPTNIHAGKVLFIPNARKVLPDLGYRPSVKSTRTPVKTRPPSLSVKSAKAPATKKPARNASPLVTKGKAPAKKKEQFAWPVKGKIIKKFGKKGSQKNNGVEIAVPRKTPVLAAAAGRVSYSGNGIQGFGNLIIIQHSDSFFTIYGFNDKNVVQTNDYVGRGDRIALSGHPGGEGADRLHFEIRYGKNAVNPILYLP